MSAIVFDVELCGPEDSALDRVIVRQKTFENTSFPIAHILNVAADELLWTDFWIELKSQENHNTLMIVQYIKNDKKRWQRLDVEGAVPNTGAIVDLYLLDHSPNRSLDMWI